MTTHTNHLDELATLKAEARAILERATDNETRLLAIGCLEELIAAEHRALAAQANARAWEGLVWLRSRLRTNACACCGKPLRSTT